MSTIYIYIGLEVNHSRLCRYRKLISDLVMRCGPGVRRSYFYSSKVDSFSITVTSQCVLFPWYRSKFPLIASFFLFFFFNLFMLIFEQGKDVTFLHLSTVVSSLIFFFSLSFKTNKTKSNAACHDFLENKKLANLYYGLSHCEEPENWLFKTLTPETPLIKASLTTSRVYTSSLLADGTFLIIEGAWSHWASPQERVAAIEIRMGALISPLPLAVLSELLFWKINQREWLATTVHVSIMHPGSCPYSEKQHSC